MREINDRETPDIHIRGQTFRCVEGAALPLNTPEGLPVLTQPCCISFMSSKVITVSEAD